jgi:hypothetical protein
LRQAVFAAAVHVQESVRAAERGRERVGTGGGGRRRAAIWEKPGSFGILEVIS